MEKGGRGLSDTDTGEKDAAAAGSTGAGNLSSKRARSGNTASITDFFPVAAATADGTSEVSPKRGRTAAITEFFPPIAVATGSGSGGDNRDHLLPERVGSDASPDLENGTGGDLESVPVAVTVGSGSSGGEVDDLLLPERVGSDASPDRENRAGRDRESFPVAVGSGSGGGEVGDLLLPERVGSDASQDPEIRAGRDPTSSSSSSRTASEATLRRTRRSARDAAIEKPQPDDPEEEAATAAENGAGRDPREEEEEELPREEDLVELSATVDDTDKGNVETFAHCLFCSLYDSGLGDAAARHFGAFKARSERMRNRNRRMLGNWSFTGIREGVTFKVYRRLNLLRLHHDSIGTEEPLLLAGGRSGSEVVAYEGPAVRFGTVRGAFLVRMELSWRSFDESLDCDLRVTPDFEHDPASAYGGCYKFKMMRAFDEDDGWSETSSMGTSWEDDDEEEF